MKKHIDSIFGKDKAKTKLESVVNVSMNAVKAFNNNREAVARGGSARVAMTAAFDGADGERKELGAAMRASPLLEPLLTAITPLVDIANADIEDLSTIRELFNKCGIPEDRYDTPKKFNETKAMVHGAFKQTLEYAAKLNTCFLYKMQYWINKVELGKRAGLRGPADQQVTFEDLWPEQSITGGWEQTETHKMLTTAFDHAYDRVINKFNPRKATEKKEDGASTGNGRSKKRRRGTSSNGAASGAGSGAGGAASGAGGAGAGTRSSKRQRNKKNTPVDASA